MKEVTNRRALMAALVTIALISFTVQSILASEIDASDSLPAGNQVTGNAVLEPRAEAVDEGGLYGAIDRAAEWMFEG